MSRASWSAWLLTSFEPSASSLVHDGHRDVCGGTGLDESPGLSHSCRSPVFAAPIRMLTPSQTAYKPLLRWILCTKVEVGLTASGLDVPSLAEDILHFRGDSS
jgi:hypothetical protein